MTTIGDRVREALEASSLSMNDVDKAVGYTGYTTRLVRNIKRRPDPATLGKIANALGVRVEWLIDGTPPAREPSISTGDGPAERFRQWFTIERSHLNADLSHAVRHCDYHAAADVAAKLRQLLRTEEAFESIVLGVRVNS